MREISIPTLEIHSTYLQETLTLLLHTILFIRSNNVTTVEERQAKKLDISYATVPALSAKLDKQISDVVNAVSYNKHQVQIGPSLYKAIIVFELKHTATQKSWLNVMGLFDSSICTAERWVLSFVINDQALMNEDEDDYEHGRDCKLQRELELVGVGVSTSVSTSASSTSSACANVNVSDEWTMEVPALIQAGAGVGTIEGIRVFMQERMCVIKCLQNVLMAANGPHQTMDLSSAPIQSPPHSPSSPYSHLSSSTSTSSSSTSASVVSVFDFTTSVIRGMDLMDDRHEHTNETSLLGLSLSKLVHLVPQSEV